MGFPSCFETEELGHRWTEDVEVQHADPNAFTGGDGECEVHFERTRRIATHENNDVGRNGPAMVLLPTPPLPLATATTFLTCGMPRFGGSPRRGIIGGSPRFG